MWPRPFEKGYKPELSIIRKMRKFTVILLMIMIHGLAIMRLIGKPVGMKAIGVILSGKVKPVLFLTLVWVRPAGNWRMALGMPGAGTGI